MDSLHICAERAEDRRCEASTVWFEPVPVGTGSSGSAIELLPVDRSPTADGRHAGALAVLAALEMSQVDGPAVRVTGALRRCLAELVGHEPTHGTETCVEVPSPWRELRPRRLSSPWALPVLRVSTPAGPFVVKWTEGVLDDTFDAALRTANELAATGTGPPLLAAAATDTLPKRRLTVRRFVDGEHVLGRLDHVRREHLAALFRALNLGMAAASTPDRLAAAPCLADLVAASARGRGTGAGELRAILDDSWASAVVRRRERLADLDVHRENIVFTADAAVRIDADFCFSGPELLGPGCQLAEGVLLYEDLDLREWLSLLRLTILSSERLAELWLLVRARLLIGLAFFEQQPSTPAGLDRLAWYRAALGRLPTHRAARESRTYA